MDKKKVNSRVESLVNRLSVRDVKPIKVDAGGEHSDPAIWITESVYIQVNESYIMVVRSKNSGLGMYETNGKIEDVLLKLKQAIEEGKTNEQT